MKNTRNHRDRTKTRLHNLVCLSFLFPFLFFGCGSYHAPPTPSLSLEQSLWTSPQISDAEHSKVFFIPKPKTVIFETKDIDTDLQFLFDDYKKPTPENDNDVEKFSAQVPELGSYVLINQKIIP
ncbi:hypothetical protein [uncultured Sphaerochaeta sp.]|uniref:hypothetical protein n=1 Tax=uncultured Sphaerochaeta sp. TaxID=886478 RepID=UPI002A0A4DFC|nr:hypothetical protein [uncultured Sphaerochaeta sp.]